MFRVPTIARRMRNNIISLYASESVVKIDDLRFTYKGLCTSTNNMSGSIKDYIKKYCGDDGHTPDDIIRIAKQITKVSEGRYSKKKARRLMCYHASVVNGEIVFDTKNRDKSVTFDTLSETYEEAVNDSDSSDASESEDEEAKPQKKFGMLRLGFIKDDVDSDEEATKKYKNTHSRPTKEYKYPKDKEYKVEVRTEEKYGPYSTQAYHDKQKNDKLTKKAKRCRKIYDFLDSIDYPEQRSAEWFAQREKKITASDGGCVVGVNKYEAPWKFVNKKVRPTPFQSNKFCYHGKKLEEIATMVYEYRMNVKVTEFGMVPHKTIDFLGASPDGIVSPYKLDGKHLTNEVGKMLEIKCPLSRKIKTTGEVKGEQCPIYYWVQVQLQLECCDLDECDFWQCEICEYDDREDFIEDTNADQPFLSNDTNMEKGALIQLLPYKLPEDADPNMGYYDRVFSYASFIYPPKIEMSPYDVDIWVAETVSKLKETHPYHHLDKVVYWKMVKTHNVTIPRDKEWFEEHLPMYKRSWGYVEYFRENQDKLNIVFDYIDSLSIKSNNHIMEVYEIVCNQPGDDDSSKAHKKYAKYIANLMAETEANEKKKAKKGAAKVKKTSSSKTKSKSTKSSSSDSSSKSSKKSSKKNKGTKVKRLI